MGYACESCGTWIFNRFEYADHVTTDCQNLSHYFENTAIEIGKNFFARTYSVDNTPKQISDADISKIQRDEYENAPAILISKNNKVVQKLYVVEPDMIYVYSDGCRFYFKKQ